MNPLPLVFGAVAAASVSILPTVMGAESLVLVEYRFDKGAATPSAWADGVEATAVVDVKSYIGVTSQFGNVYFNAPHSADFKEAVDNARYVEFTISAAKGRQVKISELRFNYGGAAGSEGAAPFKVRLQLRSSADGYAAPLATTEPFEVMPRAAPSHTPVLAKIELPPREPFTALNRSVSFRIYAVIEGVAAKPGDKESVRLDNLTLLGALTP